MKMKTILSSPFCCCFATLPSHPCWVIHSFPGISCHLTADRSLSELLQPVVLSWPEQNLLVLVLKTNRRSLRRDGAVIQNDLRCTPHGGTVVGILHRSSVRASRVDISWLLFQFNYSLSSLLQPLQLGPTGSRGNNRLNPPSPHLAVGNV